MDAKATKEKKGTMESDLMRTERKEGPKEDATSREIWKGWKEKEEETDEVVRTHGVVEPPDPNALTDPPPPSGNLPEETRNVLLRDLEDPPPSATAAAAITKPAAKPRRDESGVIQLRPKGTRRARTRRTEMERQSRLYRLIVDLR